MIAYWTMFMVPALAALFQRRSQRAPKESQSFAWFLVLIGLVVLIGYRYDVGGDWGSYAKHLKQAAGRSFLDTLAYSDPGYALLNWISAELRWGIFGVNLMCGAMFGIGLIVFCRHQPLPWLALLVSMPYLVIVVAMGYSRQAVAIGFAMLALVALGERRRLGFVLWIAVAATFHKSAIILVPLAALAGSQRRVWTAAWVGATGVVLYYLFVSEHIDTLYANYIETKYASEGALVRVLMNAVPALAFLALRHNFPLREGERKVWTWMALFALGMVVLLAVSPSSTAVDRMALHLIPLQLFVFSRLPLVFAATPGRQSFAIVVIAVVIAYHALVLFVWLTHAKHAFAWLPYQFYPFLR